MSDRGAKKTNCQDDGHTNSYEAIQVFVTLHRDSNPTSEVDTKAKNCVGVVPREHFRGLYSQYIKILDSEATAQVINVLST